MPKRFLKNIVVLAGIFLSITLIMNWHYVLKQVGHTLNSNRNNISVVTQKLETAEPNQLRIPALNIIAPIKFIEGKTEKVFQEALAEGVVHYPGTAQVGEVGNMYIFGHSSDLAWSKGHYKTVFALLPDIKIDERIFVSDGDGKEFEYKVTSTKVVSPSDLSVLSQDTGGKKMLSVQTSYPVGTALKRFVVIAELVE